MKPLYGNMDDAQYIKELEARCCRAVEKIERLTAEGKNKDKALALAWDAVRWADSIDELEDAEQWTEIPTDRAVIAFDAVWRALGEKIPDLASVSGSQVSTENGQTEKVDKRVCHADGDRCLACPHYYGKADVCSYAPADSSREHDVNILGFPFHVMAGAPEDCIIFIHDGRFVGRIDFDLTAPDSRQDHDAEFWKRRADQRQETINKLKRNPPDAPEESGHGHD